MIYYKRHHPKDEDPLHILNPSCAIKVSNALKFESDSKFSLLIYDSAPASPTNGFEKWAGKMDYFDESEYYGGMISNSARWHEWGGRGERIQSFENMVSGKYELYLRGENNTRISNIKTILN